MDLFDSIHSEIREDRLVPGATVLRHFASRDGASLWLAIEKVLHQAPLRHMITAGGSAMSVQMSNCGRHGWVSDSGGYRYSDVDPATDEPWPDMPEIFSAIAAAAAAMAGYPDFRPDACLINCYAIGARMGLHQDRDERDFRAPIVSVSLGLPAVFLFGGNVRSDKPLAVPLAHGDVVVWGGPARQRFHGVRPIKAGDHALTGSRRFNLTLRKAG
ncbi:MAG: DNA oxidative demethylase AlkB [Dokdonella sp.]